MYPHESCRARSQECRNAGSKGTFREGMKVPGRLGTGWTGPAFHLINTPQGTTRHGTRGGGGVSARLMEAKIQPFPSSSSSPVSTT